jgi:FxsC-like protein
VPYFDAFFSYARDDFDPYMDQFLKDLTAETRLLLGRGKDVPIFFRDENDIDFGKPWRPEIISALQSARVLVAVQTPRYFIRPYCGKEVGVMRRRRSLIPYTRERTPEVLPVIWCPSRSVPPSVNEYQWTHAELPASYPTHGLLVLLRNTKYRDEYLTFLRFFALAIQAAIEQKPVLPGLEDLITLEGTPDIFHDDEQHQPSHLQAQGPRCTRFSYAVATRAQLIAHKADCSRYDHERGEYWKPFTNTPSVGALASKIAGNLDFVSDLLPLDDQFVNELRMAEDENSLIVVVVDAWTIEKLESFRQKMECCDRNASTHCAVFLLWNQDDPDTKESRPQLEDRVSVTFPVLSTREQIYFRPHIACCSDFESMLCDTLKRLQGKIIAYGKVKRGLQPSDRRSMPMLDTYRDRKD